ncbi:ATP-grasp domain-containing protein [Ramlibacter sp. WS9]|uniref:ATP-grasp domain-containing protein n=1 Tax=Ramlibacter sp. WS9 TaxID=1882741 RepID=UPI0013051B01|nr:ATP-grasp domain-containing protein [Ramlibacter sp. WS9]
MSDAPILGRDLRCSQVACYHGPNIWSQEPALVCHIAIEPQYTAQFAEGAAKLARLYGDWVDPALLALPASEEAIAKVLAQWTLGALNEVRGYLHEAGARQTSEAVALWVAFHHPKATGLAMELALRALAMATAREDFSPNLLKAGLDALWQFCFRHHPDYQARILMAAARHRDVPVLPFISESKYWQYGWGARGRIFMETLSNADGNLAGDLALRKPTSKAVFAALGMPTPRHVLLREGDSLEQAVSDIGFPCVVKPTDMGGGKGVTAGIQTMSEARSACEQARRVTDGALMVEQMVQGMDYRLMLIGGRLVAAIRREPSSVVGDGQRTVRQLIGRLNADRSVNMVKSRYRRPVALDNALVEQLARQGVGLDAVLPAGTRITLRSNSNISTGGVAVDVTDQVHPSVTALAEQLAVTVGLETAGLDYLTTDITRSPLEAHGAFIEMNTTPGLDVLTAAGWPDEKIGNLVLGEAPGRIPVGLCVLPELDIEAARRTLGKAGDAPTAAWVCGQKLQVGPLELRIADPAPWATVRSALRNKTVTSLQIACTVDDIVTYGLPVDRLDRVVMAGVSFPERWQALIERYAGSVEYLAPQGAQTRAQPGS